MTSVPALAAAPVAMKPAAVTKTINSAILHLDWAHETAGTAVNAPLENDPDTLTAAIRDTAAAANLLGSIPPSLTKLDVVSAAQHATRASKSFEAAFALHSAKPEPKNLEAKLSAIGEAVEKSLHKAYQALGTDRD